MFALGTIAVVPIMTLIAFAALPRTPVRWTSRMVGTGEPLAFGEVTLKGSVWQPDTVGLVILQITARPLGPLLVVSTSGWAATTFTVPRMMVPLLLITSG